VPIAEGGGWTGVEDGATRDGLGGNKATNVEVPLLSSFTTHLWTSSDTPYHDSILKYGSSLSY